MNVAMDMALLHGVSRGARARTRPHEMARRNRRSHPKSAENQKGRARERCGVVVALARADRFIPRSGDVARQLHTGSTMKTSMNRWARCALASIPFAALTALAHDARAT